MKNIFKRTALSIVMIGCAQTYSSVPDQKTNQTFGNWIIETAQKQEELRQYLENERLKPLHPIKPLSFNDLLSDLNSTKPTQTPIITRKENETAIEYSFNEIGQANLWLNYRVMNFAGHTINLIEENSDKILFAATTSVAVVIKALNHK